MRQQVGIDLLNCAERRKGSVQFTKGHSGRYTRQVRQECGVGVETYRICPRRMAGIGGWPLEKEVVIASAMARVFITGSADGLGLMAARLLAGEGHEVVVHGRSEKRAAEALKAAKGAEAAVHGDLSSIEQTKGLAKQVNALGQFDAVIHNAGLGYQEPRRNETKDGLPQLFAVNTLAPYILTALIERPKRLIYLSSGMHRGGDASLSDLEWKTRSWEGAQAYSDTKLHDTLLAFAVARRWPAVMSNSVEPGWVATKMGGAGAPDDLEAGPATQVWLAVDPETAATTGGHFYHLKPRQPLAAVRDQMIQDRLLEACAKLSGVPFPD
jgi:NAD(P)-dependent dehydrogenase (short-subunit alcohol dehydrogenase family)